MARTAKTTRTTEAVATPVRRGRPPGPMKAPVAAPPTPKVSKDELRAQVEELARKNAALRAKNRESGRAAKAASARIEELEAQVARLEKKAAATKSAPKPASTRAAPARGRRRERDPGDAVPPGVAVEEPEPLDDEAEKALARLEDLGNE